MQKRHQEKIVLEVTRRVLERALEKTGADSSITLDHLIHEVLYYETLRLEKDLRSVTRDDDLKWLQEARKRFATGSQADKKRLLGEILQRHTQEVAGHFDPKTYTFSTKVVPSFLGLLLKPLSPLGLLKRRGRLPDVSRNLVLEGPLEHLRRLTQRGTLIFTPTHSSNLDSIVMGFAAYKAGLPPMTYGAGLNLFQHRFLGFFMNRLGAYKVDRLKKHSLYKEVLKEYAVATLEEGYPNLFFPGGTRSRSGAVEKKLKLGLLGCGLEAYSNNLEVGRARPNVYVVPCTINYQLVLEAETLIEDHLKEAGKSRYIIADDEFSQLERVYAFFKNLLSLDAKIHICFAPPRDPFGNHVDEEGRSLDGGGRTVDLSRYLHRGGQLLRDPARDREYTKLLGDKVVEDFHTETMAYSTHVVALALFRELRSANPDPDFYRFLRETGYDVSVPMVRAYEAVQKTLDQMRRLRDRGGLRLGPLVAEGRAEEVVAEALKLFGGYHSKPALQRRGDRLFAQDANLLYYYRNRLWGYGLPRRQEPSLESEPRRAETLEAGGAR